METDDNNDYLSYKTRPYLLNAENGTSFFFTDDTNKTDWNGKCSSDNLSVVNESEQIDDDFEEKVVGKSYEAFESKLKYGFLEAPNLGLVTAPPAMFDYQPPLQRIDLKDNKIEVLPDYFFDELPFLTWCDLRYNRLDRIPALTSEHKNLCVLLLQDNRLTSLPYSLARAVNLHTLGWTNNDIVDPPLVVLLQGCKSILEYMRTKLSSELNAGINVNDTQFEHDDDEQLKMDLAKTAKKHAARRTNSRHSMLSNESTKRANELKEEEDRKRRIDRLKYTWDLWKSIPYNGVSNHTLFEKSVQEVKDEVKAKLNQHKEAVLQKIKDNDALNKWRWETKMLQMKGPTKPYSGVERPFGTEADNVDTSGGHPHGYEVVDPATFRSTMTQCMKRLQYLADNPSPLTDTEKSLERLKEVEDIQRKLFDMKLKWSVKSSNPI